MAAAVSEISRLLVHHFLARRQQLAYFMPGASSRADKRTTYPSLSISGSTRRSFMAMAGPGGWVYTQAAYRSATGWLVG